MEADPADPSRAFSALTMPELLGITDSASAQAVDEVPERFGLYEVDRVIARGGHGTVFKGTDDHGLRVAIKWLKKRRDESELDTYVQLSKTVSGLPPILSSGVMDDRTYFVMPYYARRSLRFRLRSLQFPQPLAETIRLASAITEVLGELHRHGYTHSDFKPDNVLLETLPTASEYSEHSLLRHDERLVLSDFGTIRSADGVDQFGDGTLGYAAPELFTKLIDHDPRIDIYAASATLVECVTGVAPVQARRPPDSPFDDYVLSQTGPLETTLRKGLSFEADGRPEKISDWFESLHAAADTIQQFANNDPTPEPGEESASTAIPQTTATLEKPTSEVQQASRKKAVPSRMRQQAKNAVSFVVMSAVVVAAYWALTSARTGPSFVSDATQVGPGETASPLPETAPDGETTPALPETTPNAVAMPTLLETVPDATSGTGRTRLTATSSDGDQTGQSDGARYHRVNSNSRRTVSTDGRWLLALREAQWTIVERSTGEYRALDIEQFSQPAWHHSEPDTILHLGLEDLTLRSTTTDGQSTIVADLRERITAELPEAGSLEAPLYGGPSADGQRYAWVVADSDGDLIGFVTYDLSSDTILGIKQGIPGGDIGSFDSIAMAKSGDTVVMAFSMMYVIYNVEFGDEWQIKQRPYSYELALSGQLQDVLIDGNFDARTLEAGWVVAYNLDDRSTTRLVNLYDGSGSDVLFSGLATEKPGWVLASTHDCELEESMICDRVMALNIDDGTVIDLAKTDSCAESSFSVPTGAVNSDFTKAWFNTDFGSCDDNAVIVELTIDQLNQ